MRKVKGSGASAVDAVELTMFISEIRDLPGISVLDK